MWWLHYVLVGSLCGGCTMWWLGHCVVGHYVVGHCVVGHSVVGALCGGYAMVGNVPNPARTMGKSRDTYTLFWGKTGLFTN